MLVASHFGFYFWVNVVYIFIGSGINSIRRLAPEHKQSHLAILPQEYLLGLQDKGPHGSL